ncbi:phosphatase PAP2 family protein, partial [candidate division KSB1 bacterium]|nr:phosphatase PAP2 family protein [candidate division KSB1 bacterium]
LLGIDPLREASWQIIVSLTIASTIKNTGSLFIGRHRPSVNKGAYAFEFWEGVSFPSGHSSNAFQVATILSHHVDFPPFTVLAYGLASCVAFQRLDANLHWTTDVVFGALLGTTVAKTIIRLHEKRTLYIAPKVMNDGKSLGIGMTWAL